MAQHRIRHRIDALAQLADDRYGVEVSDYQALHRWSVTQPEQFWGLVWEFFDLRPSRPYDRVLGGGPMPEQRWFEGARLNYVDHVLRHRERPGDAVISHREDGTRTALSWAELDRQTRAFAHTLRDLGVGAGDRVVGYLTNGPEAIVAFLGTAAVGAVWAGCAPDLGGAAAADRFAQLEPVVLVATTAYQWAGRAHDRRPAVAELAAILSPRAVIAVERAQMRLGSDRLSGGQVLTWAAATRETGALHDGGPLELVETVEQVGADHPLWVLFSSGTTGVPKGIVHGHAGVLAAHVAMLGLQHDLGPEDTMFWHTTTTWMLWNIVVSALLLGATTVTYEGSPAHPAPERLWEIVADEGVTMFGTSPGHLMHAITSGLEPAATLDLSALEQIAATGAPVATDLYAWVHDNVGADIPLISTCGGTDVVSAFLGGAPGLPVRAGEIPGPVLGVAAAAFDPHGRPVRDIVGELVVTAPYPSMPVSFWNDPDGQRYRRAYFDTYPGIWRQGDWATHTSHGSFIVHGRSDATLNRNGVRLGSADIYQVVERDPAVAEALVLGVEMPDGTYRMPLFVVPVVGAQLSEVDLDRLRDTLRRDASPRHVPDEVHVVEAIPHTRTGKKLEVPLKRILQGASPADVISTGAVDRPELLDHYAALARQWHASSTVQDRPDTPTQPERSRS